jgi:positive regulator of sigma E activity
MIKRKEREYLKSLICFVLAYIIPAFIFIIPIIICDLIVPIEYISISIALVFISIICATFTSMFFLYHDIVAFSTYDIRLWSRKYKKYLFLSRLFGPISIGIGYYIIRREVIKNSIKIK